MTKDVSPIYIADDEARRHNLVEELHRLNIQAVPSSSIPFDYLWMVDGKTVAGERKSIGDFIASYGDERLHNQISAMHDLQAVFKFILIEGVWSKDGMTILNQSWTWDQFDNALLSIECDDVKVVHSFSEATTPRRLASVYKWTMKDDPGSWHDPMAIIPANDFKQGVIFFDKTYRNHIGTLMHIQGVGAKVADDLLTQFAFKDILGIEEAGLQQAIKRWKSVKGIGPKTVKAFEEWVKS